MASSGKKKTTFAKLQRESRLRERRQEKQLKKEARKRASAAGEGGPADAIAPAVGDDAVVPTDA